MNENLILAVFKKMTEYRPALQKYLIPDDDDDDVVDYRVLGDLLIKNFPWPIGVELRRLFSGSMKQLDRARLDQIFKTIERTVQFISFVLIAQLWEERREREFELSQDFLSQFENRISVLSLGNFTWLIRAICKVFEKSETDHFITEKKEIFNKKFFDLLDFWVPERNEIGHYQINLTQDEIEKRCVEYAEKLKTILCAIAFLARYKLVTVRQISVEKQKYKDAVFNHHFDLLNSSDSDFKAQEVKHTNFIDSNSVLLLKDFKSPHVFINLSPLIIDTHTEIIDSKDKFNIKKDIFSYTKFQNNKIFYVGTEITEKCDLSFLSNYQELVELYKQMISDILKQGPTIEN